MALSATAAPRRFAPAAGTVTEPVGRVRSTVVGTRTAVWRPALSVARTRRSRVPSAGMTQETVYGGVVSTPSDVHVSAAQESSFATVHCSKLTLAMPLPTSVAVATSGVGSDVAALTGLATLTASVGTVLSTVTVIVADVKVLPAL